eukprot:scaffold1346_cov112-Cylindrotheca_fusiformis.AAC.2
MSVAYGAVNTLIVCWAESSARTTEDHKVGWKKWQEYMILCLSTRNATARQLSLFHVYNHLQSSV